MPDTGCNTQSLVDSSFVRRNKLERIPIVPREVKAYDDRPGEKVQAVVRYEIDIGAHKSMVWAYEVERMKDQEIILGLPWLQKNSVAIEPEGPQLFFQRTGHRVSSIYATDIDLKEVSAAAYIVRCRSVATHGKKALFRAGHLFFFSGSVRNGSQVTLSQLHPHIKPEDYRYLNKYRL